MQQALLLGFVNRYFLPSLIWNTTTDSSSSSTSSIRLSVAGAAAQAGGPRLPFPGPHWPALTGGSRGVPRSVSLLVLGLPEVSSSLVMPAFLPDDNYWFVFLIVGRPVECLVLSDSVTLDDEPWHCMLCPHTFCSLVNKLTPLCWLKPKHDMAFTHLQCTTIPGDRSIITF